MLRTKLLSVGKLLTLAVLVTVIAVLVAYLTRHGRPTSQSVQPRLQGRVVAVFNNTKYAHEVDGRVRFVLSAGTDRSYEDGTHELEQVNFESHGSDGTRTDRVTADRAKISDTTDLNSLDAEFSSNVVVKTTEGLTLRTNRLLYNHDKNTVETSEPVDFDYKSLSGKAVGMIVEGTDERIRLLQDVDVIIKPATDATPGASGEKAARKAAKRARKRGEAAAVKPETAVSAGKDTTHIRSQSAVAEKQAHRVTFSGNVNVAKNADEIRASLLVVYASETNKVERIEARGDSQLKSAEKGEIKSSDMDFFFDDQQNLVRAVAKEKVYARSLGDAPLREAHADTADVSFTEVNNKTAIASLIANGNAAVTMHAPPASQGARNPARRDIAADNLTLQFNTDNGYLKSADAHGNAVITVTPSRAERGADKKTMRAPLMNAVFYDDGNRMKRFTARNGVRAEIEATVADSHPPRITTSKTLIADFSADSQDIDRLEQEGDVKYNEGDRNAIAQRSVYEGGAELLTLRGNRPTAWDSKARTQADEIDYDRRRDETHARGDVRTTYYSADKTNEAAGTRQPLPGNTTPFKKSKSPVFVTADRADASNADGIAVYTGNARGWQDDNFVKADRIELRDSDKRMIATGHVESALYTVERETSPGKREVVPGFGSADQMVYSDTERMVRYDGSVKARQGTDQIEAAVVDVYLEKETNEVDRLDARGNVVLIQPGRKGTGDRLDYSTQEGRGILWGKNARIDDNEKGSVMGSELTFYFRDDKITAQNKYGTGRVRSTHRLKNGKEK